MRRWRLIGSGLGSAGFIVIGDDSDPVSVAAGVSRFLAVESCGQCTPCKQDGVEISGLLAKIVGGQGEPDDLVTINERLETVTAGRGAAWQRSTRQSSGASSPRSRITSQAHLEAGSPAAEVDLIAALVEIGDAVATVDPSFADKQPDWTFDPVDSGKTPVERYTDHRADESVEQSLEVPDER